MSLYNKVSRKLILPLSDFVLGNSISKQLDFLEKSQWWPESHLLAFQEERLQLLIKHVYEYVPFYREHFDRIKLKPVDIKRAKDLNKIPVINKGDIRKIPSKKFLSTYFPAAKLKRMITSGSTGQPFQFYINNDAYSMWVAKGIRGWQWMGYQLGDSYAKLSQNPRQGFTKKAQDILNRSRYLFIEHLSEKHYEKVCAELSKYNPDFIRCYPDPLLFLAKYILINNIKGINPKAINTTGNILYPEAREIIEKAFKAPVYDSYSCEGGPIVSQAPGRDVYLSSMEYAISEYLTDDGNDAANEVPGRLITTDLWNFANPLIRYDTQDLLVKTNQKPECGRQLEAVKQILGRDSDVLITPDGRMVIVHIFTIYFEWKDSIDQFQVRQHNETDFEIYLKVNKAFSLKEEKEIYKYWQLYFGKDAKLKLSIVDSIPASPSGKRKFLIRDNKIELKL